jgi:hypothetical protein
MSEEQKILYKGELIPISEYEKRIKEEKPITIGKRAEERWIPLLKFLNDKGEPVPLKIIVSELGPKIANSLYSLKAKGYLTSVHRKYAITQKGLDYLKTMLQKLEEKKSVAPAPGPAPAKPVVPAAKPAEVKKPSKPSVEPEEIFQ